MEIGRTVTGALGLWNYLINRVVPERMYVVANLGFSAALLAVAHRRADRDQLGLTVGSGVGTGLVAGAAVALSSVAASKIPATAPLFSDQRVKPNDIWYQTLVRIPLGTVLLEEVAFRSVLPALLEGPNRSTPSLRSAVLFGLWHVVPTLKTLDINEIEDPATRARSVTAGVAGTAIAGWLFDRLRLRTGTLLTPMLIHWSANAFSYAIAAQHSKAK